MLELKKITALIIETEKNVNESINLFNKLNKKFKFDKMRILIGSDDYDKLYNINENIELITIPKINLNEYNNFCVHKLKYYVDTDYMMMIQLDGYPIRPDKWTDEFYECDYIGAPWLSTGEHTWVNATGYSVGNGGFCLRSKKFLDESSKINYDKNIHRWNEDGFLCCFAGNYLRQRGIVFADEELASKFSIEYSITDPNLNNCFGFHGKFNIERALEIEKEYE